MNINVVTIEFNIQGFIEFMISDSAEAKYIRDNYIVKIVPMLNPGIYI